MDISSPEAKSSIFLWQVAFAARNLTIHDIEEIYEFASGIYGSELETLSITDSEFRNLRGRHGGAIYLNQNENSKKFSLTAANYVFTSVTFSAC